MRILSSFSSFRIAGLNRNELCYWHPLLWDFFFRPPILRLANVILKHTKHINRYQELDGTFKSEHGNAPDWFSWICHAAKTRLITFDPKNPFHKCSCLHYKTKWQILVRMLDSPSLYRMGFFFPSLSATQPIWNSTLTLHTGYFTQIRLLDD